VGVRRNEPEIFNGPASPGGAFISPPSAGLMD
jgi:hypothetical protein